MFFFIILTIVCILYYYFTRTLNYWKHRNVKGPKPIPFFGNFKEVALRRKAKFLHYNEIYKQYPEEKFVGVYQMTSPGLLIRDLDIVKQILIKDFELFPDRGTNFSKKGFGENMIHCDGETWKNLRNKFTVLFTSSKFKNKFHLLVDRGNQFVNYVKRVTAMQPEQDVFKLVFTYGVSTSIVTTFGWDVNTFTDKPSWFHILDQHFINSHWYETDLLFPSLIMNFGLTITTQETIKICKQILKTCVNQRPVFSELINNVKDVLINLRHKSKEGKQMKDERDNVFEITDDLLAGQVWVFHIAGYINNTLSMTYALYYLARDPVIQDKLRDEIDEVMNKCEGEITYEIVKEMKYLKMVFDETLRMHPTSHVITRSVKENVKLDGTDLVVAKGSTVIISPFSIQHDEKYYPDPEKFDPERFAPHNSRYDHSCVFLSFGAGRRGCLATQYARLQFSVGLMKLLYNFRVEITKNTCSKLTYDPHHMLIKPKPSVILKFIPREK